MLNCAACGIDRVHLYDNGFDAYFCDERCHSDYCHDHFDDIYSEWAAENLETVEAD